MATCDLTLLSVAFKEVSAGGHPSLEQAAITRFMKVRANDYYRFLAAQYLRKQLKQLSAQFDGIRSAENAEFVHRARVASRRLRAALRMFRDCLPRRTVKQWRKTMRRVTKELGDARDRDVQIAFMTSVLQNVEQPAQLAGIARILVKLELAREGLQPQILAALDRLQASGALEEMNATAKAMLADEDEARGKTPGCERPRELGEYILSQLEELLSHQDSLSRPDDAEAHHAMRIAAKRLRYSMEICKPAYNGHLEESLTAIKEVQGLLGEIHDCDVWNDQLGTLLADEREWIVKCYGRESPLARLQVGVDYLRQECRRRRDQRFQRLVSYWQELDQQKAWARLTQLVYTPVDQPPTAGS